MVAAAETLDNEAAPESGQKNPLAHRAHRVTRILGAVALLDVAGIVYLVANGLLPFGRGAATLLVALALLPATLGVIALRLGLVNIAESFHKRDDSEHEQIMIRVVFVFVVVAYLFILALTSPELRPLVTLPFLAMNVGMVIAWSFLIHVTLYPRRSIPRRLLAMQADLWILTYVMSTGGEPMAVWTELTSPHRRPAWEGIEQIEETSASGRRGVGTMSACVAERLSSIEEILEWRPFEAFVRRAEVAGVGRVAVRHELVPEGSATRLRSRWYGARTAAPLAIGQRDRLIGLAARMEASHADR